MADVDAGGNKNFDLGFMKMNYWLLLGMLVAVNATAQNSTNALPPIPAPANATPTAAPVVVPAEVSTNAPAKKTIKHKKKAVAKKVAAKTEAAETAPATKKIIFSETPVTLVPGPATVAVDNLNVRGQAGLKGEVVAHLKKDESVTVLSEITLDKHKADEPSQWAKISLPASTAVWVRTSYIDAKDKTVTPKKLNLRGGPSEDYSVLGVVEHGTVVNEVGTKGEWTKISAPASAYAFIAAIYLKQEASGNVPTNFGPSTEVPVPPVETNTIPTTLMTLTEPPPLVNQQNSDVVPPTTSTNNDSTLLPPPIGLETTNTPAIDTNTTATVDTNLPPPPPRIVTHEGYVRSSVSVVAPTYFELYDPITEEAINYLYSTTTNLNLSRYNGFKIVVTGEESLDARWKDTPVLTVQKIYVLSTNALSTPVLSSPRGSTTH
jgi:uncharacterized protein YgiM (DUF1202 family)